MGVLSSNCVRLFAKVFVYKNQPTRNSSIQLSFISISKKIFSDDMFGLEPVVFMAKGARAVLTINLR